MRNTNKKGFTIVELVIVVAVIAILAAVLIPTFSGIIRKANISSDTVVAKNLNTAVISASADTFEEALAAVREAGYYVANLNAKAADCYFVWEDDSNQFILYDLKNSEIIYSNTEVAGAPDASWCFAVSNATVAESVKAMLTDITIKNTVASVADVKDIVAAGGEVTIYIDESVVLDADNLLTFTNANSNVVINMGNSQLTSSGSIDGKFPIDIDAGTVTINGGIIGATGTGVDLDGTTFATPIDGGENSNIIMNDTQINGANSPIQFQGTATLNNVKLTNSHFYSYRNGNVTLNNCVVEEEDDVCIWVTNTIKHDNGEITYDGTSTMTVKSGKYTSNLTNDNWGVVSVYGGTINIEGGEFTSADGHMFGVLYTGKIVITGGTFNGVEFEDVKDWEALCAGTTLNVAVSNDGATVTIINSTYTK